ncbi:hypothetical protein AB0N17_25490 [Streptomyces sp. NPDC051133]|uniref:hypothetical protein n=1 Tax=Streptomyces sp. NPDC051133 TaxID=3155521 RepID=UPI00343B4C11
MPYAEAFPYSGSIPTTSCQGVAGVTRVPWAAATVDQRTGRSSSSAGCRIRT